MHLVSDGGEAGDQSPRDKDGQQMPYIHYHHGTVLSDTLPYLQPLEAVTSGLPLRRRRDTDRSRNDRTK